MIRLEVTNLGTGTPELGNYRAFLTLPDQRGGWESHEITIEKYDRSKGWFALMCKALVDVNQKKTLEDTTDFAMELAKTLTDDGLKTLGDPQ